MTDDASRLRWRRARIVLLGAVLLAGAALVGKRAHELQVKEGSTLKQMAEAQYLRNLRLSPKRGTIYDRHGAELAVSVELDSVWADPLEFQKAGMPPAAAAAQLSRVLRIDAQKIARRLASKRRFAWIKRRITPTKAARVRQLKVPGIHMEREARRFYPNRALLAHVLGFSDIDGKGIEGLELALDERLRGSERVAPAIRDRRGQIVFSEQLLDDRSQRGDDLILTIDKTIQHIAERELQLAAKTFEARAGHVVVMDPRTGELLAVANYPSYDPNRPGKFPASHRRNRAVTDRFEPGSTVKPFTVAAALGAGTIRPTQVIDCEDGALEVAEYTIHDSKRFETLTPAQILAFSSNIGTAKIGATLSRKGLFRAFRRFGFGVPTGLPVPGETGGILRHYKKWYDMDAATISFGQGVSVTSVQMATAMSVIANRGRLMRPILVRRVQHSSGEIADETLPLVRRQVVPERTARLVADMLTAVTGPGGTGSEASIPGFLVAGKTGTAQKADYVTGGYASDRWLASFVGFVPARSPRVVISVVLDEPLIAHTGGTVAAPVFRRVGRETLRHLGVPGEDESAGTMQLARSTKRAGSTERSKRAGVVGKRVTPPGRLPKNAARGEAAQKVVVPDFAGASARVAIHEAIEQGLWPRLAGSGIVVNQHPAPEAVVRRGTSIRLSLSPRPRSKQGAPSAPVEQLAHTAAPSQTQGARGRGELP